MVDPAALDMDGQPLPAGGCRLRFDGAHVPDVWANSHASAPSTSPSAQDRSPAGSRMTGWRQGVQGLTCARGCGRPGGSINLTYCLSQFEEPCCEFRA